MKNIVKLIFFILYTIGIFFLKDFKLLILFFLLNFILGLILKIDLGKMLGILKIGLPFIIFTIVIDMAFDSILAGIRIGIRLIICYQMTYIFSKTLTILEIAEVIQQLCFPLKMLKINTSNIGLMIAISISMIPVLKSEIFTLMQAMKAKGKTIKINSTIMIMKPMFISILRKTSQIEKTLKAKAYIEE